jgi:hypothetical protein
MKLDPRRALIGLTMAGALIITPPVVGYAVGPSDLNSSTGSRAYAYEQSAALRGVMADDNEDDSSADNGNWNDNDAADDNGNWNDNDSADDNGNVNDNAEASSPPAQPVQTTPAPASVPEPGVNGQDDPYYQYHNDPNNN